MKCMICDKEYHLRDDDAGSIRESEHVCSNICYDLKDALIENIELGKKIKTLEASLKYIDNEMGSFCGLPSDRIRKKIREVIGVPKESE